MYSRYIPNEQGGFDRRRVPDPAEGSGQQPTDRGQPPTDSRQQRPQSVSSGHDPPPRPAGPPEPSARPPFRPGPAPHGPARTAPFRPAPPPNMGPLFGSPSGSGGLPGPGALSGPGGLLGRLLPRGLDPDDLLILAVLLLAMRQDGASGTELLLAAGLYLLL